MSASQTQLHDLEELMQGGAPVPPVVERGQFDPRAIHYGYSAGERELVTRAPSTGFASVLPGLLVPLRLSTRSVPNDTMEALEDAEAPQSMKLEVTPRDKADALMSRYQHRGFRIFMPFLGMPELTAAGLFKIIHPRLGCQRRPKSLKPFEQAIVDRHCVTCRIEDMLDGALDRIEKARLSNQPTIEYGKDDSGGVRMISLQEAVVFVHESILGALHEHHAHMIDTLQQSKADVEAGRNGPGKKKYDVRDEWYFLMTHKTPNDIEALAEITREQTNSLARDVGSAVRAALDDRGTSITIADVKSLLQEQELRLRKEFAAEKKKPLRAANENQTEP